MPTGKAIPLPFALIPILFAFVAVYILSGRFIFDAVRRANTKYAVTNERALILSGILSQTLNSMPITLDLQIAVSGRSRGSIKFGPGFGSWSHSGYNVWQGPSHPIVFERIAEVRHVYQIVRDVQQGRRQNFVATAGLFGAAKVQ